LLCQGRRRSPGIIAAPLDFTLTLFDNGVLLVTLWYLLVWSLLQKIAASSQKDISVPFEVNS
jgi:hypothetical protein